MVNLRQVNVHPLDSSALEALNTALVLHLLYSYLITPQFIIQVLDNVIWCVSFLPNSRVH